MDDTVKQVDFSYLMKNSRGGKFADIKLFKSYRVQAEMISWGKGEIMVFCSSLYEAKRKVYKGISLGF